MANFFTNQDLDEDQEQDETAESTAHDRLMSSLEEVDKRLHKASYYRAILDNSLFGGDTSDVAEEVESEFREFARKRLSVLMGIETESAQSNPEIVFLTENLTEERVEALVAWADKLLAKPHLLAAQPQPQATPVMTAPQVTQHRPQPQVQVQQSRPQVTVSARPKQPEKQTKPFQPVEKLKKSSAKKKREQPEKIAVGATNRKTVTLTVNKTVNGKQVTEEKEIETGMSQNMPKPGENGYKPMPMGAQMLMATQMLGNENMAGTAPPIGSLNHSAFNGASIVQHFMNRNPNEVSPNDGMEET